MDNNTKTAVVILIAAILISIVGPLAIAFALGYLSATLLNSPDNRKLLINKANQLAVSLGWKKLE